MMKRSFLLCLALLFQQTSADEDVQVTCGSAVKLTHSESKNAASTEHYLNSEDKALGSGSGQQIVTMIADPTTTNTLWWIRGPDSPRDDALNACSADSGPGEPIECGSIIRLTHLNSMKNLHSHTVQSPLSRQQEVTAFGQGDGNGDGGDDWKITCEGRYWLRGKKVYFQHIDTGRYLGGSSSVKFSHQNCGHNCPLLNHLEAFGRSQKDGFTAFSVEAGVHLSK